MELSGKELELCREVFAAKYGPHIGKAVIQLEWNMASGHEYRAAWLACLTADRGQEPVAYRRVSNISGQVTGLFSCEEERLGIELKTERLEPLYASPSSVADVEKVKHWVCHNGGLLNEWAKDWRPSSGITLTSFIRKKLDAAIATNKEAAK